MSKHLLAAAMLVALAPLAHAQESYSPFDNFSASQIDPARWLGSERIRAIKSNALSLMMRDFGDQVSNSGARRFTWSVSFDEPARIKQMRAYLTVKDLAVNSCPGNASAGLVNTRVIGGFFNAGAPLPGNQTNDVIGQVTLTRRSDTADAAGVLRVGGSVFLCGNIDCSTGTSLGSVDLGSTVVGTQVRLSVEWDQATKRFQFTRDTGSPLVVTYAVADGQAPGVPFKSLQLRTEIPNCMAGARQEGMLDAVFDYVQVNASGTP
jgi:hypothetical protein